MKKRTRAHEAGSIEAGSSKSKSIFLLIVSMGQSALLDAQSVLLGAQVAVWGAKLSHTTPNRASQAPHVARLLAQLTARMRRWTGPVEQFRY